MQRQFTIKSPTKPQRIVIGWINDQGVYSARLYTNNGQTACYANKIAKKRSTILKWAQEVLVSPVLDYQEAI